MSSFEAGVIITVFVIGLMAGYDLYRVLGGCRPVDKRVDRILQRLNEGADGRSNH